MDGFVELDAEPVRRQSPLLIHEHASAELGKARQRDYEYALSVIEAADNVGRIPVRPLELARIKIGNGPITALALSPDSSRLAVACGKTMQLWATDLPACISTIEIIHGDLKNLRFSPDSKWICGSVSKQALRFDVQSELRMTLLAKHSAVIQSLTITHDSQRLFSVSENGHVGLSFLQADPASNRTIQQKLGGPFSFRPAPILSWLQQPQPDSNDAYVTICQNGKTFVWDGDSYFPPSYIGRKLDWHSNETQLPKTIHQTAISSNNAIIALLHSEGLLTLLPGDSDVKLWDEIPNHVRQTRRSPQDQIQNIEFLADPAMLWIAFERGSIALKNLLSGQSIAKLPEGSVQGLCMATSLHSYIVATVSNSVDAVVWDTEPCKTMDEVLSHIGSAAFIAVSHENSWLLSIPYSTTTKETFCLWNMQERKLSQCLPAPRDTTTLLARFSHDSKQILCLSRDFVLSTLDVSTGKLLNGQRLSIKDLTSRYLTRHRSVPLFEPLSISFACHAADISRDLSVVAAMVVVEDVHLSCGIGLWDTESGRQIGFFDWVPIRLEASAAQAFYPIISDLSTLEITFSSDAKQLAARFGTWITVYDTSTGATLSKLAEVDTDKRCRAFLKHMMKALID